MDHGKSGSDLCASGQQVRTQGAPWPDLHGQTLTPAPQPEGHQYHGPMGIPHWSAALTPAQTEAVSPRFLDFAYRVIYQVSHDLDVDMNDLMAAILHLPQSMQDQLLAEQIHPAAPAPGIAEATGEQWGAAVNAMTRIFRRDMDVTRCPSVTTCKDALEAALRALEGLK